VNVAEVLDGGGLSVPSPDISVDVKDFSTPDPDAIRLAALMGLQYALQGFKPVYVGCGFGIGRTGTMLGLMARIAKPWIRPCGVRSADLLRAGNRDAGAVRHGPDA
ncbi:hypothetical protein LCGC14_3000680, partial [marine sediment metagenome]